MDVNFPAALRKRYQAAGLGWRPVLAFLPARLVFALVAQGAAAALLAAQGTPAPWQAAAAWWPVSAALIDLLCLGGLAALTRREGLGLTDLFGAAGWKDAARQLAWTPIYLLAVAPGVVAAHVLTTAAYGPVLPPMLAVVQLPPAGAAYALLVWPVLWVVTEELVYLGFLLPRLEALTGRTWSAALIVIGFWGLQHLALPFIADPVYLAARPLAAAAAISCFPAAFVLGRRRLIPLIGVHYLADLATAGLIVFGLPAGG